MNKGEATWNHSAIDESSSNSGFSGSEVEELSGEVEETLDVEELSGEVEETLDVEEVGALVASGSPSSDPEVS